MAATRSDEGQRQCCLDHVGANASRSGEEVRWLCEKSPRWSAGRRACRKARGAPSQGAPVTDLRQPALRLPQGRQMKAGRKPGDRKSGADDLREFRAEGKCMRSFESHPWREL